MNINIGKKLNIPTRLRSAILLAAAVDEASSVSLGMILGFSGVSPKNVFDDFNPLCDWRTQLLAEAAERDGPPARASWRVLASSVWQPVMFNTGNFFCYYRCLRTVYIGAGDVAALMHIYFVVVVNRSTNCTVIENHQKMSHFKAERGRPKADRAKRLEFFSPFFKDEKNS